MPEPALHQVERIEAEPASSFWRDAWHRLLKNKLAVFGLAVVATLAALCFSEPFLCRHIIGFTYVGK